MLQLISGCNVIDENQEEQSQSLLQWAEVLIEKLALHELINPHIGKSYDTYELYHMARTTYFCVRRRLEMRPSMGQVGRSQAIGPVRIRRDAIARAMRGWHSQRLLSNGYAGDSPIKEYE
ncbi:proline-rich receptor-like protein kinase PERK8 isoform X3 [Magnolia sinica]|uniref:proline-rich receptor-like protein kinase PERK8 isoform X3 n=1 Tax=Magnolia sinica TaxID=86752 RepID=UPI002659D197|nr:proline-rich receptor-like protein kinase PERK8 isoform X3 [Magnolia sinica]